MNNQNQISERQNDCDMLNCQYASRVLFNRAEKYGYHALVCIIASAFCVFITGETSSLLTPVILDILLIVFGYLMRKNQSKAAKLRNFFDSNVLGIQEDAYSDAELRSIHNEIYKSIGKKESQRNIQTTNSGRDNPPGVKNWYEFSKDYLGEEAVLECQRQNCWWNDTLCIRRVCITIAVFVVTTVIYWLAVHWLRVGGLQAIVCFAGMVIGLVEQIVENYKYIVISKTMDDLLSLPDISHNPTQIEYLQRLINSRREFLVLEINWIHQRNAKKWSEQYENLSNH